MASWPSQIRLNGWFVRLLGHGHQDDHIHPDGWLSGVIYLKVPKTSNRDEGAIEFGLHGFKYPILNEEYPRTLHRPEKGQIVLFPSSLFHRTVPISADDERLSIAFNLIPDAVVMPKIEDKEKPGRALAFDLKFQETVQDLLVPGMGTENIGLLLYSLVHMTRSWRILEVGLGYTTPFLAQALKDLAYEYATDIETLINPHGNDSRRAVLSTDYFLRDYKAVLHAIDDYSIEGSSAHKVMDVLAKLKLQGMVKVYNGDFRGMSQRMDPSAFPLDLVWFDCGGVPEYVDFLDEFWPLINADGGLLLLHFTYWNVPKTHDSVKHWHLIMGSIANEIKRQQAKAGVKAKFEVLSLVEPHKTRQGSVTMVRRLGPASMLRDADFQDDFKEVTGGQIKPMSKL
jgi:predicted O-methyltransferase YrrM